MNSVRRINELNKRELETGVSPEASWHADYRDTAYIYIGGLPHELSEGDVITIFSQFGEPTHVDLIRDKETGKSRGFAFLKYEDQRSTDLAVDNLGGAVILGRTLNVDHTRYQKKDEQPEDGLNSLPENISSERVYEDGGDTERESSEERPMIKEELELAKLLRDLDDEDPMKSYFIQEKKDQIALALAKHKGRKSHDKKHRRHHRSRPRRSSSRDHKEQRHSRHHDDRRHKRRD